MTNLPLPTEVPPLDQELLESLLLRPHGPLAGLTVLDAVGSTNTHLIQQLAAAGSSFVLPAVAVAEFQTDGKGRSGRVWQTPLGSALTASLIAKIEAPIHTRSWIPLLVGLAVVTALRSTLGVNAVSKWPNDILVPTEEPDLDGWVNLRKLGGILVEVVDADTVVIGVGLNVTMTREQLPVPSATSLYLIGSQNLDRNMLLASFAQSFAQIFETWADHNWDIDSSGLKDELVGISATLGSDVRVELTDGTILLGKAVALGSDGALEVVDSSGATHTVRSGDVYHLRLDW